MSAVVQASKSREAGWPVTSQLNSVSRHRVAWRLRSKCPLVMATMKPRSCKWIMARAAVAVETMYGPSRLPCRESDPAVVVAAVEHGELDVDGARVTIETPPGLALHHAVGEPDITFRGGALLFHADCLPRA